MQDVVVKMSLTDLKNKVDVIFSIDKIVDKIIGVNVEDNDLNIVGNLSFLFVLFTY